METGLTDGGDEGGVEGVLAEPEQEAGFTDAAVTDEQQFEQIVVRLRHFPAVCPGVPDNLMEPPASSRSPRHADTLLDSLGVLGALVPYWFPLQEDRQEQETVQLQANRNIPQHISGVGFSQ